MARQASWIHGVAGTMQWRGGKGDPVGSPHTPGRQMNGVIDPAVSSSRIEWSDHGYPRPGGATWRGRAGQRNSVHFPIPTPSWRDGVYAHLLMYGFLVTLDNGVVIEGVDAFDAHSRLAVPQPAMPAGGSFLTLVGNVNRFDFDKIRVEFGLQLTFHLSFDREGDVTFHSVGVDFEL